MSYYNPASWIPSDDQLIDLVEQQLQLVKHAVETKGMPGKSFVPSIYFEYDIIDTNGNWLMRLIEWRNKSGKIFIELTEDITKLRKGHFNQNYHTNPNGTVTSPHHIHFPTIKYNLDNQHTYAYSIQSTNEYNYIAALKEFCDDVNIVLGGIKIPLIGQTI